MNRSSFLAAAAGAAALCVPAVASADSDDFERRIFGRVESFEPFNLELEGGRHIFLHRGTVLLPTGLTLRPGMYVRVEGHRTNDGAFAADRILRVPPPPRDDD